MARKYRQFVLLSIFLSSLTLYSQEEAVVPLEEEELVSCNAFCRQDAIPQGKYDEANDLFLEGYIQALIDMNYYEDQVNVSVKDHKVYLSNLPKNDLLAASIIAFVRDIPCVEGVEVTCQLPSEELEERLRHVEKPCVDGVWFPQSTVLFSPLVASPREVTNSAAYRYGDKVAGRHVAAVSMGDDFPIFRWRDVFCWHGDLQIGIAGCIWAVFNYDDVRNRDKSYCELVNTDYYLGFPLTYAFDQWSFRLRVYHISSHLGDEFMVNHPDYLDKRVNPSFEAIDLFGAYQFSKHLRVYVGPGVVVHSDKSFKLKPLYVQWGAELRVMGRKWYYHRVYGTPFFAFHMENWQERGWDLDATYKIGYEWSKLQGIGRKVRIYLDYHQGYSEEGQFFKKRTRYGEVGLSWGF